MIDIIKSLIEQGLLPLLAALLITTALGPVFIPWLHKLKFGQEIREEGPSWHQKKSGTPTMGGIMFILGITAGVFVVFAISILTKNNSIEMTKAVLMLITALAFGLVGFVDDYIKVVKKRNLGLTASHKFILQMMFAVLYLIVLNFMGELRCTVLIPFLDVSFNLPIWLYIIFALFVVTGTVNAVNLTDGLDGLASSVTLVVSLFFAVAGIISASDGAVAFMMAVCGGMIGFLIYNKYPAKVFMGDTGSLFLGGAIVVSAIGMQMPLFLIIAGFVYFMETLSVILQVISFKLTGKRIFKMSPIHHHFEMCGWNEKKIVFVFTSVTVILCIAALAGYIFAI